MCHAQSPRATASDLCFRVAWYGAVLEGLCARAYSVEGAPNTWVMEKASSQALVAEQLYSRGSGELGGTRMLCS